MAGETMREMACMVCVYVCVCACVCVYLVYLDGVSDSQDFASLCSTYLKEDVSVVYLP